ncbi:uncharacterized protein G2W53_026735 [Senna tora]|uniref:Uncharacterized protein n=1 Tax=Senna tora TaxID=362788 RepID=A0A834TG70_9FABA|nr:uncharacterized protein G2W53_026735 [Senna tora]
MCGGVMPIVEELPKKANIEEAP